MLKERDWKLESSLNNDEALAVALSEQKTGEVVTSPALLEFLNSAVVNNISQPKVEPVEVLLRESNFSKTREHSQRLSAMGLKPALVKALSTKVFQTPSEKMELLKIPNTETVVDVMYYNDVNNYMKPLKENGVIGIYFNKLNKELVKFTGVKEVTDSEQNKQLIKVVSELPYLDFRSKRRNHEELFIKWLYNFMIHK